MSNGITVTNAVIECLLSRSAAKYPGNWAQKPRRPMADVLALVL
jgi:hypothetical protein